VQQLLSCPCLNTPPLALLINLQHPLATNTTNTVMKRQPKRQRQPKQQRQQQQQKGRRRRSCLISRGMRKRKR